MAVASGDLVGHDESYEFDSDHIRDVGRNDLPAMADQLTVIRGALSATEQHVPDAFSGGGTTGMACGVWPDVYGQPRAKWQEVSAAFAEVIFESALRIEESARSTLMMAENYDAVEHHNEHMFISLLTTLDGRASERTH